MNLERSTIASFVSRAGSALLVFLGFAVFSKVLGGGPFGTFVLFLAVVNVVSLVADLGLQGAVEKRISEGHGDDVLASTLLLKSVFLTGVAAALFGAGDLVNRYVGAPVTAWIFAVLVTEQFARVFLRVLKGEMRVSEGEIVLFGQKVTFVGVGTWLSLTGGGVSELVLSYWLGWLFVLVWAGYRCDTTPGRPRRESIHSLYQYSKYNAVSSVISRRVYGWVDVLVVGAFLTQTHVAAYEMSWRVAGVVMLLPRSIGVTIFPRISDWHARGQVENVEELLPSAFFGAVVFVVPAIGGVWLLAPELLSLLFRPEFAIAAPALVVLTVGKLPEAVNIVVGRTLLGVDWPRATVLPALVLVGANLGLNLVLVPPFGLVGAAVATSLSITLSLLASLRPLRKRIDIVFPTRGVLYAATATLLMTGAVHAFDQAISVDGLLELGSAVAVAVATYVGSMLVNREVRISVADFLATLAGR